MALVLMTLTALPARSGEAWWGLWNTGQGLVERSVLYEGENKMYVRLTAQNSPLLKGGQVNGMRFYLSDKTAVRSAQVWVATNLTGTPLLQQEVTPEELRDMTHDGEPTVVRFSVPVDVLPATNPYASVYVGFTLQLAATPMSHLMASEGKGAPMSNYYNGMDAASGYGALALQVLATGPNIVERQVSLLPVGEQTTVAAAPAETTVTVVNEGSEPVSSVSYVVTIDNEAQAERTTTLTTAVTELGRQFSLPVSYDAPQDTKEHALTIAVTKVNGEQQTTTEQQATLVALAREAVKRTVMEEFTGTWCLNCVRGFAGIELLEQQFGDHFIAIAMHSDDPEYDRDPMVVSHYRNSTFYKTKSAILGGLPSCTIDRWIDGDPYCGYQATGSFQTNQLIAEALSRRAVADMSLRATWTDDSQTAIKYDVTTDFLYNSTDAHYSLILVLTADGLTGEGSRWSQNNGYNDYTGPDEALLKYAGRGSKLTDMIYDHVAVDIVGVNEGIAGSINSPLTVGEPQHYSHTLDVSSNTLIQNREHLNAIAMLINTRDGSVVNAAKVHVEAPTGVAAVKRDGRAATTPQHSQPQVGQTKLHDLLGRQVATPTRKGIYIVNGRLETKHSHPF